MPSRDNRKIVLIVRETRLDELKARFNTVQQAQFYVEHLGADFSDYVTEHRNYQAAVTQAQGILRDFGRVQRLERRYLSNFIFGPEDLVVALGQDGLVANTLKYLDGQHVIGLNPDPKRWDGILLPFRIGDLAKVVDEEVKGGRPIKTVTMAKATLNTGTALYAVNDLFIGPRSHVSARYALSVGGKEERQSSSGIIVSTGLGSTGWLKSIYAGWRATTATLTHADVTGAEQGAFAWDAEHLHYFVREPFPSRTTGASLVIGQVDRDNPMVILSEMPEHGVIFSDGLEADFLEFNSGTKVTIGLGERHGMLVA
jgi:NAD kinase